MYFRIIVKQDGAFLFRTSKIEDPTIALNVAAHIKTGFVSTYGGPPDGNTTTVEILQVTGLPQGAVITESTLAEIAASAADND